MDPHSFFADPALILDSVFAIILRSVKKNNSPDDNHGAALLEHFDLAFHPTYTPGFQVNLKFQWPENRGSKLDDIIKH